MEIREKELHFTNCEVLIENNSNVIQPAVLIKTANQVLLITSHPSGFVITDETGCWDLVDGKSVFIKEQT